MADAKQWEQPTGGASGSVSVWNMLTYKALLAIFWMLAFLVPWLWLALAYMLKACEAVFGKVPVFGKKSKDIA